MSGALKTHVTNDILLRFAITEDKLLYLKEKNNIKPRA